MVSLQHFSKTTPADQIWEAIDADGGVIVDGFIEPDLLAQIQSEVMPHVADHHAGLREGHEFWEAFHGTETKRITGVAEISRGWWQLLCDPLYQALGDHYLGDDDYYLNTAQLICIGPDETSQIIHRDELNWPEATCDQEITITAIFALTDFTEQNGATVLAPGSHKWPGALPEVKPEQTCQAVMKAGSALLYSGKIMHGGGPNSTADEWRVGIHAGFLRGWLRSEENHQLTTTLETAKQMPEFAQRMLGFRSYSPPKAARLGMVNYEDAAELLRS